MKILCERNFPYNYIYGIEISKHFNHELPVIRKSIVDVVRTPEFKEKVAETLSSFKKRYGDYASFKDLTLFTEIELFLLNNDQVEIFGSGK